MNNGMRRMICVVLAVMMLPFFVACGEKKDQVVHVGETVKYGDIQFTLAQQQITYDKSDLPDGYIRAHINISCGYTGDGSFYTDHLEFHVYADGKEMRDEYRLESYSYPHETLGPTEATVSSGRTSDLWIGYKVPADTKKVEFDYSNSRYTKKWGKVTFALDIPQDYQPKDDWILGKWSYDKEEYGEIVYATEYVFGKGNAGIYTHTDTYSPQHNKNQSFTYRYLDEDHAVLVYEDGGSKVIYHKYEENLEGNVIEQLIVGGAGDWDYVYRE